MLLFCVVYARAHKNSKTMVQKFRPTFLCLLLPVILVSAVGASSGGSASGDLFVFECKIPPYSNRDRIRVNPTDEELDQILKEGKCYLACVTEEYKVTYIQLYSF